MSGPLKRFVEQALTVAGVEHDWRSEELVRLHPHPELSELFGEASELRLALSQTAAQEQPAALLCTAGSFAFDQLVRLCHRMPGAFYTSLAIDQANNKLPPGLPSVANGQLAIRNVESMERQVAYALFRVGLQSDELVERLMPVALDSDGALRPELLARLESCPRIASRTPAILPDRLLTSLEAETERAALALAREHWPEVEARRQREFERLELYLRELRDDLAAALPGGSARRAARIKTQAAQFPQVSCAVNGGARRAAKIKTQARVTLDALRSVLTDEEPWDRDALLAMLRPRFGWAHRQNPARQLAPEARTAVLHLVRRLPARFTIGDVERVMGRETERRLNRLDRGAGNGERPTAALEEQEQRLEEEHRTRVADIEAKFHLRVLAQPVLLEWLHYPVCTYGLAAAGAGAAEWEAVWDALAEAWHIPPCPSCGARVDRFWICERDHLACEECASVCRRCRRARCSACAFARCVLCQAAACEGCGVTCERCGSWSCDQHGARCLKCDRSACTRCGGACSGCSRPLCPEHGALCALCDQRSCEEHTVRCAICERAACREHGDHCPACSHPYCRDHAATCHVCRQSYCARCASDTRRCATCRSLELMGPLTTAALQSRIRDSCPGIDPARFRSWWLARNSRHWIVVARRWPWNYVFVVKADTRDLVSYRRYWSWTGP